MADCNEGCGTPQCFRIFDRIRVLPLIAGGTRVEFVLHPEFTDPGPYTFQLQVGRTGVHNADDWHDVGSPATNTYYLVDDSQRVYGKTQWTHYRIILTTLTGTYSSEPAPATGELRSQNFRIMKELLRQERLLFKQGTAGQEGFLLKRRLFGTACSCLDGMTQDVTDPECPDCYGTGILGGYFLPEPCIYMTPSTKAFRDHRDMQRGTVNDISVGSRMLAVPQLNEGDVWVSRKSDMRWFIHAIQTAVELEGVPVIYDPVQMNLAPFSDIIYRFPIADQLA